MLFKRKAIVISIVLATLMTSTVNAGVCGRTSCDTSGTVRTKLDNMAEAVGRVISDTTTVLSEQLTAVEVAITDGTNRLTTAIAAAADRIVKYQEVLETARQMQRKSNHANTNICHQNEIGFSREMAERQTAANMGEVTKQTRHDLNVKKPILRDLAKQAEHLENFCNEAENAAGKCSTVSQLPDGDIDTDNLLTPNGGDAYNQYVYTPAAGMVGGKPLQEVAASNYIKNLTPVVVAPVTLEQSGNGVSVGGTAAGLEFETLNRTFKQNAYAVSNVIGKMVSERTHAPELLVKAKETPPGLKHNILPYKGDFISPREYMRFLVEQKTNPEYQWAASLKNNNGDELKNLDLQLKAERLWMFEKMITQQEQVNLTLAHMLATLNNTLLMDKMDAARSKVSSTGR